MNHSIWLPLATKLCGADMTTGFISLDPVMNDRNELIEKRLHSYCEQLQGMSDRLERASGFCSEHIRMLLPLAAELTCMDIQSGVISVDPVLYDRDEKIDEHLCRYFSLLHTLGYKEEQNITPFTGVQINSVLQENSSGLVLEALVNDKCSKPVFKTARAKKRKKKK